MSLRSSLCCLALLLTGVVCRAQFTISENDPSNIKWYNISTRNFRVIYPDGADSLALSYIGELEKYRPQVANSLGMVSGQFLRKPLDVVLHTRNSASNGLVAWTPSRMEMITTPQWNEASALPWITELAVHEGRHAAQMQAGYKHVFRPLGYILGQLVPGAVSAYPGSMLMEGDAVVAETALTKAGRGRQPLFLGRYMYSMDNGDLRNYPRWRFGSYYNPTPNNYALGYAIISGVRVGKDAPYFMADYMDYISRRPYDLWPLRHAMRRVSGKKFRENFNDAMRVHYDAWAADTLARTPFTPADIVSAPVRRKVNYSNPMLVYDGTQLWVKEDIYNVKSLVAIEGGKERKIATLASYMGHMSMDPDGRWAWWSELSNDPRWGQIKWAAIREYDALTGKMRTMVEKGRYYNPAYCGEGRIVAVEHGEDGSSSVVVLDRESGVLMDSYPVPDGVQAYSAIGVDGKIYMSGTAEDGMGLWLISANGAKEILTPVATQIEGLQVMGGALYFASDHNGSREFYRYSPDEESLRMLTSTKYGGTSYAMTPSGDVLMSQYHGKGIAAEIIKAGDVLNREVEWAEVYHYPVADALAAQEDTLTFMPRLRHPVKNLDLTPGGEYTAEKPYRKALNAFRIHSWAPLYVDTDVLDDLSMSSIRSSVALGASMWFQNSMSTLVGQVGYKAAPDANRKWLHSAHVNLTYKGLYPVFELKFSVNERKALSYSRLYFSYPGDDTLDEWKYLREERNAPYVSATLRTYVPLQWNTTSFYYGLAPSLSLRLGNDLSDGVPAFLMTASARAYIMGHTPSAAVYPRWGAGVEMGWLDPYAVVLAYGYVPGIAAGQGLRLSAAYQFDTQFSTSETMMAGMYSLLPRGYASYAVQNYGEGVKLTAEYAIPFPMGDWNIGSAFMCRRGILTPHYDWSAIREKKPVQFFDTYRAGGSLWSAGFTFEMEFASFFWIKTPVTVGITYSYNGGSLWAGQNAADHHYVGPVFNIKIPN